MPRLRVRELLDASSRITEAKQVVERVAAEVRTKNVTDEDMEYFKSGKPDFIPDGTGRLPYGVLSSRESKSQQDFTKLAVAATVKDASTIIRTRETEFEGALNDLSALDRSEIIRTYREHLRKLDAKNREIREKFVEWLQANNHSEKLKKYEKGSLSLQDQIKKYDLFNSFLEGNQNLVREYNAIKVNLEHWHELKEAIKPQLNNGPVLKLQFEVIDTTK